jgi:O-antigen/teichoic acid export membrane protein
MSLKSTNPNQRFLQVSLIFSSGLLRNILALVLGLVATPALLRLLGEEVYGAWLTLVDWIGHLGLLEFGLSTALLPIFAKSLLKNERLSPHQVAREAIVKYFWVILAQIACALVLGVFIDELIPVTGELQSDLKWAFLVMTISTVFSLANIFRAYLLASHQGYWVSLIMGLQNIVVIAGSLLAAYLQTGITGQAVSYTLAIAITLVLYITFSKLGMKHIFRLDRKQANFNVELKTQRLPHFVAQLCGRITLLIDRLIIAAFLGPVVVTSFYLTQRLINIGTQQLQQIGNSTWSAMSELYYKGEFDKFNERLLVVTEFIACFSSCGLCTLILFNQSFVSLWVGEKYFVSQELSNLIILNSGLLGINTFWHWCFTGTGLIKKMLPLLITQSVVSLSIALTGVQYLGVYGPPLGTLLALSLVTQPWTTYLLSRNFQSSILKLSKAWIVPFVLPTGLTIVLSEIYGVPHIQKWDLLVIAMLLSLAFNFTVFPFILLSKQSREFLYARVKKLFIDKFK